MKKTLALPITNRFPIGLYQMPVSMSLGHNNETRDDYKRMQKALSIPQNSRPKEETLITNPIQILKNLIIQKIKEEFNSNGNPQEILSVYGSV